MILCLLVGRGMAHQDEFHDDFTEIVEIVEADSQT